MSGLKSRKLNCLVAQLSCHPMIEYGAKHIRISPTKESGFIYGCNQVKRRGKQCPASIHVLYHSESECVIMYKTEDDHLHKERRSIGINRPSKEVTWQLFKMKIKPTRIIEILEEKGQSVPKKQQLSSYFISLRKKYYDAAIITLTEVEA